MSVSAVTRIAGLPRQEYYVKGPGACVRNGRLIRLIQLIQELSGQTVGRERMWRMVRGRFPGCSGYIIRKLMRENGLQCTQRVSRGPAGRHGKKEEAGRLPGNELNRNFHSFAPDRVLLTDITYIASDEGFLYMSALKDVFGKKIANYRIGGRCGSRVVLENLMEYAGGHDMRGTLVHSDRGPENSARATVRFLSDVGARQSMSRPGKCRDNAPMESFFGQLKSYLRGRFGSLYDAGRGPKGRLCDEVRAFVHLYNDFLPQKGLGWRTPSGYQEEFAVGTALAVRQVATGNE